MSALYLAANKRDSDVLDIFFIPDGSGRVDVWASVHVDFACEIEEPDWSVETDTRTLSQELSKANGEPVEVVLLTRARYDELVNAVTEATKAMKTALREEQ